MSHICFRRKPCVLQDVIKIGHVGDRRLVVRKHGLQRIYGKERPTLEIIHLNPTGEHFMNVIRYKEDL